jgi:hypothetical protein
MKKILILILALVIFVGFAITSLSAPPPSSQVTIRNEEELARLRMIVEAGEEDFKGYSSALRTYEAVIAFLELLDSLPIPYSDGMQFSSLTYYPNSSNRTFDISLRNKTGEGYSYRFFTAGDRGRSLFERHGEPLIEIYRSQDGKIIIYSPLEAWGSPENEHGIYIFPMEINGFFIRATYSPWDSGITDTTPQNIYRNMVATSLKDVTWIVRYLPSGEVGLGDVEGDDVSDTDEVTTSDALEILRAATGLATLTDAEKVRLGISGEPTTADALRVLRIATGL